MRERLFFLVILIIILSCNTKENFFEIRGKVDGVKDNSVVYLFDYGLNKLVDSTYIANNEFSFKGDIIYPSNAAIAIKDSEVFIHFWLEKGEILINSSKKGITREGESNVIGGTINTIAQKYERMVSPLQEKQALAYKKLTKNLIREQDFQKYVDTITKASFEFFLREPNNYFTLSQMNEYKTVLKKREVKRYYEKLTFSLKESPKGKLLKEYIDAKELLVGDKVSDIKGENLKGETIKLSDFNDKVILLDFWASWCKPCIEQIKNEFPKIKKEYGDSLVILSFSFDIDKKEWEKTSKDLNINWINISNLIRMNDNPVARAYGVEEIPTSFIIGKDGKIIKRINFSDNLEAEIKRVLKD